jgi:cyclophilin family peptidyl-prolyl cis-trans isomerase
MARIWSWTITAGTLLLALLGCGGGGWSGGDPITGITATNFKYGQKATLTLTGNALDNVIKLSSDKCLLVTLDAIDSSSRRQATCIVAATGPIQFTVKSSADYVVYNTALTAPEPQVTLVTSLGSVVIELNPTAAPITVKNFLAYVNQSPSFYSGTLFHRVISGFMAQGGGFTTGMTQKSGLSPAITLESQNGLLNLRGAVAMARTNAADSATSQFFVNLVDNAFLNYASTNSPGYAVFGKVVSGMDVIDLMATKPTATKNGYSDVPVTDITILSATQTQ